MLQVRCHRCRRWSYSQQHPLAVGLRRRHLRHLRFLTLRHYSHRHLRSLALLFLRHQRHYYLSHDFHRQSHR
jgi:hypothetical protein